MSKKDLIRAASQVMSARTSILRNGATKALSHMDPAVQAKALAGVKAALVSVESKLSEVRAGEHNLVEEPVELIVVEERNKS